jgi:hypothetical protein
MTLLADVVTTAQQVAEMSARSRGTGALIRDGFRRQTRVAGFATKDEALDAAGLSE